MNNSSRMWSKRVAVIIAHPNDETILAGGTILSHPSWDCFIACLCLKLDDDQIFRFNKALEALGSQGKIMELEYEDHLNPFNEDKIEQAILDSLPSKQFDLIISHNPIDEYSNQIQGRRLVMAVMNLWCSGNISTAELWTFARESNIKGELSNQINGILIHQALTNQRINKKRKIITDIYGIKKAHSDSKFISNNESFWQFKNNKQIKTWLKKGGIST